MDVPRDRMIDEILEFVAHHPDSTASLAVARRILGEHEQRQTDDSVAELRRRIGQVDDGVLESYYFIIK